MLCILVILVYSPNLQVVKSKVLDVAFKEQHSHQHPTSDCTPSLSRRRRTHCAPPGLGAKRPSSSHYVSNSIHQRNGVTSDAYQILVLVQCCYPPTKNKNFSPAVEFHHPLTSKIKIVAKKARMVHRPSTTSLMFRVDR